HDSTARARDVAALGAPGAGRFAAGARPDARGPPRGGGGAAGPHPALHFPPPGRGPGQPWVPVALAVLRRALASTPSPRSEEWMRWLFLIPYSIPVRGRAARRTRSSWPCDPRES